MLQKLKHTFEEILETFRDEQHTDWVLAGYLLRVEKRKKARIRRDNPYQFGVIFNTGG